MRPDWENHEPLPSHSRPGKKSESDSKRNSFLPLRWFEIRNVPVQVVPCCRDRVKSNDKEAVPRASTNESFSVELQNGVQNPPAGRQRHWVPSFPVPSPPTYNVRFSTDE